MNSPARDLVDYLDADSSLGLTLGTDLFALDRPDSPDLVVSLHDTGGGTPDGSTDYRLDRTFVQITVRGERGDLHTAWQLAYDVRDSLRAIARETINGTVYIGLPVFGDVAYIGRDQKDRPLYSANFRVLRTA